MVEKKVTVAANHVTKRFDLAERQSDKVKAVFKFWGKGIPNFWAVKGVSFEAHAGETIGVIGTNGSGKSTLLEMVAGLTQPTSGQMTINGSTSIIAIGAGMRPQLTGRANIRLKALMQGMTEKEIDEKMDDIIEFSELGDFIDQPVKSYSSGMKSKLGFAISVYSDADIVIIDEALSVGDPTFTQKSMERTKRFKEEGKTIFFVSHSAAQMRQMADRVIWMHYGDIRMDGPIDEVMPEYEHFLKRFNRFSENERLAYQKRYKDAQKSFTLEHLKQIERNRQLLDDPTMAMQRQKENAHAFIEDNEKMGWVTRIFLVVMIVLTVGLINKQLLNMSWANVMAHPTHLVTNFAPSKLAQLDRRHGRDGSARPQEAPVYKVAQNTYTVQDGETLAGISQKTNISVEAIMQANQLTDQVVTPGQVLTLPVER
ncbi:ATP-binding cassette domain-containing protein [Weissella bombi]|uniref:Teichoic acid transport system ATP-binding protein n=1 Tax=Weissella bombi TaxID=1505725 RepID=A0A1C3ZAP8_9LACO|nr:ATP-binding cassette domain-containing protein [Weissella bombi]SCB79370.1 teichoic acid transport system ATP-binding protein [Weissella bombi]